MNMESNASRQKVGASTSSQQLVTFTVDGQTFGISALRVRDVLREQPLTIVPLARPEIAGTINLRGHIVTAINVRARLGTPPRQAGVPVRCVVVEAGGDSYCLIVDSVGDVISVNASEVEPNPGSLQPAWAQVARGVYRASDRLLLLLDVDQLLTF